VLAPGIVVHVKIGVLEIPVALSAGNCKFGTDKMLPTGGGLTTSVVVKEKTFDHAPVPDAFVAFTLQ
jgi:hypothetical protein